VYQAAQGLTAQQPDVLIHRVLAHIQHLFDCRTLDATMARMNQVRRSAFAIGSGQACDCTELGTDGKGWRAHQCATSQARWSCPQLYKEVGEKRSFHRNLAALLGLSDGASCATLMNGVRATLPR
jgi:hypothetical protein